MDVVQKNKVKMPEILIPARIPVPDKKLIEIENQCRFQSEIPLRSNMLMQIEEDAKRAQNSSNNNQKSFLANYTDSDLNTVNNKDQINLNLYTILIGVAAISTVIAQVLNAPAELDALLHGISKNSQFKQIDELPVFKTEESKIAADILPSSIGVTQIIPELSNNEVFEFLEFLTKTPLLGLEHTTGKKILSSIRNVDVKKIQCKLKLTLYHGRIREDNNRSYTEQELLAPPYLTSKLNRYNMPGISSYYLTENLNIVLNELGWKDNDNKVDAAIIEVNDDFTLVDLTKQDSELIKYCYINSKGDTDIQAYIIPNFIADCCRIYAIDGIKYKSVKDNFESTNYVLFNMRKNLRYKGKFIFDGQDWSEIIIR